MTTMDGLFKVVYADKLQNLIPDFAILQKRIAFSSSEKELGQKYIQPVNLAHEAGFTYAGSAGNVVTLSDAVNGVTKPAEVVGSELILKAQLSYKAVAAASQKGQKAFVKATSWKVSDMNDAMRKRLEISFLYGSSGLGTVESLSDLGSNRGTIVVTAATWAGGIWAGSEGAFLDAYTSTTKNNTGTLQITKVDSDTRTLTVAYSGTWASDVAVGDELYFAGSYGNEMAGLKKIITNSTTLFNIDASAYSLWKGNTITNVGTLSHGKIQSAIAKAVNKGLQEKVLMMVSPAGWTALNTDMAALRMFDSSYKSAKLESGAESLVFHSTNGSIEVLSHPLVKDGDYFILPEESVMRIGSTDVTFSLPGSEEQFFMFVPNRNAVELQCMADQALFVEKPAHCVYGSGITYA